MARNVLANLLPELLDRIGRCARPDQALIRLEQLTERTGAASAFYRTLLENEPLRDLLIAAIDLGDLAASRLVRHPELLDSLAEPLPDREGLRARWRDALARLEPAERAREVRRFKSVEELKLLIEWVARGGPGAGDGSDQGRPAGEPREAPLFALHDRLSLLAECSVEAAAGWAWSGSSSAEPDWVILALGKLGGRELTVHSDLDLVVVYDGDPGDSTTFMARQELVAAFERLLEEPTADGVAYAVDTRLRPEGKKGALAMPFVAFERYLRERAEIWERLAWTRGRSIAGSPALAARVEAALRDFVYGPWDGRIAGVMADIRRRMERELTQAGGRHLEFKVGRGGLADLDFALQMIQIREGATREELRVTGTRDLLARLGAPSSPAAKPARGKARGAGRKSAPAAARRRFLETAELAELAEAHVFLRRLELFSRMDLDSNLSAQPTSPDRLEAVAKRMGFAAPAGEGLVATYERITARVREVYESVLARLDA
jgi:glutamate-ammonia-ligase adenylyltransferase